MSASLNLDLFLLQFSATAHPFSFSEMKDCSMTDEECSKAGLKIA